MGKRQAPKSAFRQRVERAEVTVPPQEKSIRRPALPDYPMFAKGPVRADKYGTYIFGVDEYGDGATMIVQCRGWGYLTGHGKALALDGDTAIAAQKKTLKFIADAINEKLARDGYLKEPDS